MRTTLTIIIALALGACGSKPKSSSTTPKTDPNAGSMGGATYGKPATAPAPTPPTTGGTATPNPCGAGM